MLTCSRVLPLLSLLLLAGCEDALLDYQDPDILGGVTSASGALALMNGTVERFGRATSGDESLLFYGGLLADEWRSGDTFIERNSTDQRAIFESNAFLSAQLLYINRVRTQGSQTVEALRTHAPVPTANIGLMFALTAFVENLAGEHFCNGVPFSGIVGGELAYGDGITVDSAFRRAVASADSALKYLEGTEGPTVANLARIVRGRAFLNQGRFADAAAAVAGVPTGFVYEVTHSVNTRVNRLWSLNSGQKRYVVADLEGGNGLPFRSAADPRLPTGGTGLSFDTQTPFIEQTLYGQTSSVPVATGIEARLIEAEAALRGGDAIAWLEKLNAARAQKSGLADLADPGNATERIDLTFYERGFWFFGTGHRLGDLRRLIRQYSRTAEAVFPTGAYHKGGNYSTDITIPVSTDETNNPNFTGCIDRNA